MGRASLEGMREMAGMAYMPYDADIDTVLSWHLSSNHYPSIPLSMIPVCKEAIDAANRGLWLEPIDLPEGVSFKGQDSALVRDIIKQHHLESFLSGGDDE